MSELRTGRPLPIFDVEKWTVRMAVATAFAGALLVLARPWVHPRLVAPGAALIAFGVAIRIWGTGHLRKNKVLATGGPYAFVRHPLYIGTLLIMIGLAFMAGATAVLFGLLPAALLVFLAYYAPKKEKVECARLERIFGEEFRRYREHVRSYFPRLTPYAKRNTRFSFEGVALNREYLITLAVLFGVAVILVRYYLHVSAAG